jgi:hypothetical protein
LPIRARPTSSWHSASARARRSASRRGAYGYHGWGYGYYNDVDVRQFTEGHLAIDAFDVALRRPVWHGYGTKNVTSAMRKDPEKAINEAVTAILKDFPPGTAPKS